MDDGKSAEAASVVELLFVAVALVGEEPGKEIVGAPLPITTVEPPTMYVIGFASSPRVVELATAVIVSNGGPVPSIVKSGLVLPLDPRMSRYVERVGIPVGRVT